MLLIWAVIWYLVSRLASALRSRDRELFISNRRLARQHRRTLQAYAADHPPAQSPVCRDPRPKPVAPRRLLRNVLAQARLTVEKISARCLVLARQIQEMLQLANLRSQGPSLAAEACGEPGTPDREVLTRVEPAARQRGVRFEKEDPARGRGG